MPDAVVKLFVYGSLKPGFSNYALIERFVHDARSGRIRGILVDLGSFPALIPGDGFVAGVLLELDQVALAITDRIEGYVPDRDRCLYWRKQVVVEMDDGGQVTAWVYEFAEPHRISGHPRLVAREIGGIPVHAWPAR